MHSFRNFSFALFLVLLLALAGRAQSVSARVTMRGHVSQTVILSIAPDAPLYHDEMRLTYRNLNAHTVAVSISNSGGDVGRISIPMQIRSNVGYAISASAALSGENSLRGLYVAGARATGKFVATDAVEAINVTAPFNGMLVAAQARASRPGTGSFSAPAMLLTGPRISTAGTFNSPHNAVEVMMVVEVEPPADGDTQPLELIISASPDATLSAALSQR